MTGYRVFDDHRLAALECIGLSSEQVGSVKAVVIAGRDGAYPRDDLRSLKARDFGRVKLLTYDDIVSSLINVQRTLEQEDL
jgi:hypothetical protein